MRLPRLCFPCPISWPRILCIWAHSERANPGLVFDDVLAAGQFAILLRDMVRDTDWNSKGLTTTLSLRVSLHTGPVLLCVDPIVRHMTITGAHVSHTARIEPTVTPDEIWACESFPAQTAIASLDRPAGFELDYLGQIELAKNYGIYGLFRLRAPAQPEERRTIMNHLV